MLSEEVDCTVLKVAHHGSKTSSLLSFLKKVSPVISVISVGENNYGHPDADVEERLRSLSFSVLDTKTEGTIILETDGVYFERVEK